MLHLNPYVHTVTPRSVRLLLLVVLVLFVGAMITTPTHSQETPVVPTPEPTLAVTLEPEPTAIPDTPVPPDDAAYIATIEKLTQLIDTLLTEGGGAAALAQMPLWVLVGVCIGFAIGFVFTRLTPTKADDAAYDKLFGMFMNFLGAIGLRVVAVHPPTPPAENGGTVTTTTEVKSQTVQTPPDDEHTVGGARPPGFEDWKPRG
jgi:hypothetical protein